jgi:predicted outer membrane repeat protein
MIRMLAPALLFVLATPLFCPAVTLYVDDSAPASGDGRSWETAFQTIQEGIDAASDGDTVIVAPGAYFEKVVFNGRAISLVSREGPAQTTIDASREGSVVTFDRGEGAETVIEGFSITGGGGTYQGSGIYCSGSSPTIANCRIYRNMSVHPHPGGGICCQSSNPTISNCLIYSNWSNEWGGGIWCYESSPQIEGCAIVQNSAFYGGGGIACDDDCSPVVINCTIFGNLSPWQGGGIDSGWESHTLAINSIIWGNQQSDIGVSNGTIELRSCVYDGLVWSLYGEFIDGGGNITADPLFSRPLMPIPHLSAASPCIDAGSQNGVQPTDIDGEPRVLGPGVDIGADEYRDSDSDGLPDWWEVCHLSDPIAARPEHDLDKDGFSNSDEYARGTNPIASSPTTFYVDKVHGNDDWNGMKQSYMGGKVGPKATIQAAIDAAYNGDEVIVASGAYKESITFSGKNLDVRSASGRDSTIIRWPGVQWEGGGAVVTFAMGEGRDAILEGFGITEGYAYSGGGFDCFRSSPTIRDCAVYENWGAMEGGGFYCLESSPLIERCDIYNNGTEERGAAIHCDKSNPDILSCNIFGNEIGCCGPAGIYLKESGGLVADCKLYDNMSPRAGAIRCDDSWTLFTRCAVYGNSAGSCSGFLLASSPVTITDCVVYNNLSDAEPAIWCGASSPTIINCTVLGNTSLDGTGGVVLTDFSAAALLNTIIWDNKPYDVVCGESETGWTSSAILSHCDVGEVRGQYSDGGGNISADPMLTRDVPPAPRLLYGSPCIDAGFNYPDLPEFDIAGLPRIMYGGKSFTVDIGAYEFFYTGLQKGPGQDEATLVWSFVPDKTYSIFYTNDLFNWHIAIDNFPSSGNTTTSWTDDGSLTGTPPLLASKRFYRVLENP